MGAVIAVLAGPAASFAEGALLAASVFLAVKKAATPSDAHNAK